MMSEWFRCVWLRYLHLSSLPSPRHRRVRCIGPAGVIVSCRKENRALGEVTRFLVYIARKRQEGGDLADAYFARTECVAGVQDMPIPRANAGCTALVRNYQN